MGSGFDSSTEFSPIFKLSGDKILFAPFLVKNDIHCTTDGSFCAPEAFLGLDIEPISPRFGFTNWLAIRDPALKDRFRLCQEVEVY